MGGLHPHTPSPASGSPNTLFISKWRVQAVPVENDAMSSGAIILVILGIVAAAVLLDRLTRPGKRDDRQPLLGFRKTPRDWRSTVYHPKAFRGRGRGKD